MIGAAEGPPEWLADGAPYGSPVACCPRVADARDLLDRWGSLVVLTGLEDAEGDDTLPLIEHLARRRQPTAVVGLISRQHRDSDDLLRLVRAGVHTLLYDEDRRTPLTVRRALLVAATRCRSENLWSDVEPITPGRVRPLVAYGLKHAHEPLSVDTAARALGLHRKTLAERCMLSHSLPPQLMLGWCRMMAAAVLLEDRGRLVDHVALELDFASGTAFRNMLKRYTGLTPAELRGRGPLAEMTRQFRQAMQQGESDVKATRSG